MATTDCSAKGVWNTLYWMGSQPTSCRPNSGRPDIFDISQARVAKFNLKVDNDSWRTTKIKNLVVLVIILVALIL